jgi:hypothetical protein
MKQHSGRGLGGGIALLLTFLANIAMPFLTPHEVGNLYERKGQRAPVKAISGLWLLVPTIVGYVLVIAGVIALAASSGPVDPATGQSGDPSSAAIAFVVAAAVLFVISTVAGGIVWFVKTNNALNRYWETLARGGFTAPSA